MTKELTIRQNDTDYIILLDPQFNIKTLYENEIAIWSIENLDAQEIDSLLRDKNIDKAFEKMRSTLVFWDYYKIPISFNIKPCIKAVSIASTIDCLCMMAALFSGFMSKHLIVILVLATILSIGFVHCQDSIMKFSF